MAKDLSDKKLKKDKKEKKEKEKRADTDGVAKKKDKKTKKGDVDVEMLEAELDKPSEVAVINVVGGEVGAALVPFATPLADGEKEVKKILKGVKKCAFL